MIDFMQNLQTEEHNFQETFEAAKPMAGIEAAGIPTSKDVTGIEIRLSNVQVLDNKTPKVPPFPGYARVYFVNIIASDITTDPVSLDLNGFEKVDDGDKLSLDRTLFSWKQTDNDKVSPSQIHIFSSLIKSKKPLRDIGEIMEQVKDDDNFKSVVKSLSALMKASSPIGNISTLVMQVAGIVGGFLGKVDDKPLLTWIQSFTDIYGDFDKPGTTTKNASNKFASMNLSITIRDAARDDE